jgi:1-phosphofructokinase
VIVTLTANPSVDRAVLLAEPLRRHAVHRSESELEQPGGKGVNISRAAVAAGIPTLAVLPAEKGSDFLRELHALGIDCQPELPSGPIRVNLTITEPDGTTTKINSSGALADESLMNRLADAVLAHADDCDWVVLAGSLPPGAPDAWYAELAARLRPSRARVAVDASGGPLLALGAALGDAAPDLLKPNAEELGQLTGTPVQGPEEAARAARDLVRRGAGHVLVTLGSGGAVLVDADQAWHAPAPPTKVVSTVGAGDASLFGYLLGDLRGAPPEARLRLAVAYGSAAAGLPGTTLPSPDQVHPDHLEVRLLP